LKRGNLALERGDLALELVAAHDRVVRVLESLVRGVAQLRTLGLGLVRARDVLVALAGQVAGVLSELLRVLAHLVALARDVPSVLRELVHVHEQLVALAFDIAGVLHEVLDVHAQLVALGLARVELVVPRADDALERLNLGLEPRDLLLRVRGLGLVLSLEGAPSGRPTSARGQNKSRTADLQDAAASTLRRLDHELAVVHKDAQLGVLSLLRRAGRLDALVLRPETSNDTRVLRTLRGEPPVRRISGLPLRRRSANTEKGDMRREAHTGACLRTLQQTWPPKTVPRAAPGEARSPLAARRPPCRNRRGER
jgi:hypothetical protein